MFDINLINYLNTGGWLSVGVFLIYAINHLEKKVDDNRQEVNKKIDDLESKVADTITREEHYHDISGWRTEIREVNHKIDNFLLARKD